MVELDMHLPYLNCVALTLKLTAKLLVVLLVSYMMYWSTYPVDFPFATQEVFGETGQPDSLCENDDGSYWTSTVRSVHKLVVAIVCHFLILTLSTSYFMFVMCVMLEVIFRPPDSSLDDEEEDEEEDRSTGQFYEAEQIF